MDIGTTGIPSFPKSTPNAMLLDAAPQGIQDLARCSEDPPRLVFPVSYLDEVIEGKADVVEQLEKDMADGYYLHSILPAIEWWIGVTNALALGRGKRWVVENPRFEKRKSKLLQLLNDALSSYAAALAEGIYFSESLERSPAGVELLKRYRLYTRAVCATAQKIWPDVDLGWLLKQA